MHPYAAPVKPTDGDYEEAVADDHQWQQEEYEARLRTHTALQYRRRAPRPDQSLPEEAD